MSTKFTGNILCECYGTGEPVREHNNVLLTWPQQAIQFSSTSSLREFQVNTRHRSDSGESGGMVGCTEWASASS